jgi:hypothetical protein
MKSARLPSSAHFLWLAAAVSLQLPSPALLHAQAPAAPAAPVGLDVQDSMAALQLFNQAKYPEAAAIYAAMPEKYPTSPLLPEAHFASATFTISQANTTKRSRR